MTSHYPTTAELAAFRRDWALSIAAWPLPRTGDTHAPGFTYPPNGGAWPHEREHGIGARLWLLPYEVAARREANRMRREAWQRGHIPGSAWAAIAAFAPTRPADPPRVYPASWDADADAAGVLHRELHS